VKGASDLKTALESADAVRGKVSTVGIAANEEKARELAAQLAAWGVTRVCPLGQMQNPPLTWRHDGRPALGDLVDGLGKVIKPQMNTDKNPKVEIRRPDVSVNPLIYD
jgi:Acyl-CoA reductase (LuxC)